jgi:hypothetical protein
MKEKKRVQRSIKFFEGKKRVPQGARGQGERGSNDGEERWVYYLSPSNVIRKLSRRKTPWKSEEKLGLMYRLNPGVIPNSVFIPDTALK